MVGKYGYMVGIFNSRSFHFFYALVVGRGCPAVPGFEKTPRKSTDLEAYVILDTKNFF